MLGPHVRHRRGTRHNKFSLLLFVPFVPSWSVAARVRAPSALRDSVVSEEGERGLHETLPPEKVGGTGLRPVPSEMDLGEGDEWGSTMNAAGRWLVRPQSRGLRAGSDVSQITA